MIALLRGVLAGKGIDHLIVDVGGVGYLVYATSSQVVTVGEGEEIQLHISTLVREDAITLYGFQSTENRDAFNILRGVNKIGPKSALSILSGMGMEALARAVATDDVRALSKIPGVGKRTAERLCLELKDKLPAHFKVAHLAAASSGKAIPADPLPLALAQLDYRKSEIDMVLASEEVPGLGEASLEIRLSAALRLFASPA
jgi:Holliday junction DNA helicase RuvA